MSLNGDAVVAALMAAASPDENQRRQAEQQLAAMENGSDPSSFYGVCAEVFTNPAAPRLGRMQCGLKLKNKIQFPACNGNARLQSLVLTNAMVDTDREIRKIACSITVAAVTLAVWPLVEVAQMLCERLASHAASGGQQPGALAAVNGAVRALAYITEQDIYLMDERQITAPVVSVVMPFVNFDGFDLNDEAAREIRGKSLELLNCVAEQATLDGDTPPHSRQALQPHVLSLAQTCFQLLQHPSSSSKLKVQCLRFLNFSLYFVESITQEAFSAMLGLMFEMTRAAAADINNTDVEDIGIEAANFWSIAVNIPQFSDTAEMGMQSLLPMLIESMMYTEMEIAMLQASANDAAEPDREEDIRPRHYARENNHEDNDDDDDDDDDDGAEVEESNLRRTSARALDDIASKYGDRILGAVLETVSNKMQLPEWKQVEAAVLAIGAIADGCIDGLMPYAPQIAQHLLALLESPETHFLVVTTTLWTCAQLSRYFCSDQQALLRLVAAMRQRMVSPSKMVQNAATENLGTIIGECEPGQLAEATGDVVSTLTVCCTSYQLKNRVALLELVATVMDCLGDTIRGDNDLVNAVLGMLGNLWGATPDTSRLIFSVFEAMSHTSTALGAAVQPMAETIFSRAYALAHNHVQLRMRALAENIEPEDIGYITAPLDLICGLFDALGSGLEPLVSAQADFFPLLAQVLADPEPDVQQCGFGLAGDLSRACPQIVQVNLATVCDAAVAFLLPNVKNVEGSICTVTSNIAWMLCNLLESQLSLEGLPLLQQTPYYAQFYAALAEVVATAPATGNSRNMLENASICLGMMIYIDGDIEAKTGISVAAFARRFCESMRGIHNSFAQREMAVKGFLYAAQQSPLQHTVLDHLPAFVDLANSLNGNAEGDTYNLMATVLQAAKQAAGPQWQNAMQSIPEYSRSALYSHYTL